MQISSAIAQLRTTNLTESIRFYLLSAEPDIYLQSKTPKSPHKMYGKS
jgi:hypothetical protein